MNRVFLGLGSNVDRRRSLRGAVGLLQQSFGRCQLSPVYECPAVGFDGPAFLNMVVQCFSDDAPAVIDAKLRDIEQRLGRVRGEHQFSDRHIDIDLLIVGHLVMREDRVRLPRKDVLRYAFVLRPLNDVAPEYVHPTVFQTIAALWQAMRVTDPAVTQIHPITLTFE